MQDRGLAFDAHCLPLPLASGNFDSLPYLRRAVKETLGSEVPSIYNTNPRCAGAGDFPERD